MINYLRKNPSANSIVIGCVVALLSFSITLINLKKGADTGGSFAPLVICMLIGVVTGFIGYNKLKNNSSDSLDGVTLYSSITESIVLFVSGIIFSILDVYAHDYFNSLGLDALVVFSVFIWMVIVLTRQWTLSKRITWVVLATVFIVLVQNYK